MATRPLQGWERSNRCFGDRVQWELKIHFSTHYEVTGTSISSGYTGWTCVSLQGPFFCCCRLLLFFVLLLVVVVLLLLMSVVVLSYWLSADDDVGLNYVVSWDVGLTHYCKRTKTTKVRLQHTRMKVPTEVHAYCTLPGKRFSANTTNRVCSRFFTADRITI